MQLGSAEEALGILQSAVESGATKLGADNYRTAEAHLGLGECLLALGRRPEAHAEMQRARTIMTPQAKAQPVLMAELDRAEQMEK